MIITPIAEPITEEVAELTTEEITEPITEEVTEPTTEEVTEPTTEEVTEPIIKQATEEVTEEEIITYYESNDKATVEAHVAKTFVSIRITTKKRLFGFFDQESETKLILTMLNALLDELGLEYQLRHQKVAGEHMLSVVYEDTVVSLKKGGTCFLDRPDFNIRMTWE